MGTKTAQQRTIYNNMVISTLAVDGWAVTSGTARRGLGGLQPLLHSNNPPISGQCTNLILFDVAQ